MSDGTWDLEYARAESLMQEIKQFCKENDLECPVFREYVRSWELESTLKELKKKVEVITNKQTIIINLLAGAGCGKSTTASRVFAELKDRGVNCELVNEYAKDLVWEERKATFGNELYVFAKQQHRIHRVYGKVDVIITDAPLLLKLMYMPQDLDFSDLVLKVNEKYNNRNYILNRVKPYNPIGRNQTEDEARVYDAKIKNLLNKYNIKYSMVDGNKDGAMIIVSDIINELKSNSQGGTL